MVKSMRNKPFCFEAKERNSVRPILKKITFILVLAAAIMSFFPRQAAPALAEESNRIHGFLIEEKEGKYGIIDCNGNVVLPFDYYIPLDQFAPWEESWCVEVYAYTEAEYTGVYDLERDLFIGRMKAGFYNLKSGFFSGCIWPHHVITSDQYAAVCNDESRWALLNAETGEAVLDYQYDWVWPYVSEDWVYVWLWPTAYDERMGDWVREAAYVHLDGRLMRAPEGFYFSEEPEPVENGMALLYKEGTGETVSMEVNEILSQMNVFEMPQQ